MVKLSYSYELKFELVGKRQQINQPPFSGCFLQMTTAEPSYKCNRLN